MTAVVDCRLEAQDDVQALNEAGIEFLHVPTLDRHGFTYAQMEQGVDWVLDHIADGGRAFLHCEHGVGRGPLMTCAVLVGQGYTAPQALRIVRSARWQALPNDRQLAALLEFERVWRSQHSGADVSTVHDSATLHDGQDRVGLSEPADVRDDIAST